MLHTWALSRHVHHLHVGAHLQQSLQQLLGLAVEGAGEHTGRAVCGGQFGDMEGGQGGELSANLFRLQRQT